MRCVNEKIKGSKAGRHETSPPPVVILSCQMEVAKKNSRFRTSDDQNNCNEKKESKHVIDLVRPERIENKK